MERNSKKIFILSKQNIELAKEEVLSLTNSEFELYDNILIVNTKQKLEHRLGYSHLIYKFLFKCNSKEFLDKVKEFNWQKIYKKNFCVRINNGNHKEKEIAELIWTKLKNPKVNLSNPKTKIEFFFVKNTVIAGLFETDVDKSFLQRKAHLRPKLHPTSMHPGLARACINLTGLRKGKLLDPFCGSGGILIEAGLIGFKTTGYDIDKKQIERAKENLKYYKVKSKLRTYDSTKLDEKFDAIVTDLPYGKGSRATKLDKLYLNFLKSAEDVTAKCVVIFPNFIDYKKIISKTQWKIKNKFEVRVHRSLTRVILNLRFSH